LRLHGDVAGYEVTHKLETPYAIATEGEVSIVDDRPAFDLTNRWQNVDIAAGVDRSIRLGDGDLRIAGSVDEFNYEVRSNVSTDDVPPLLITAVGGLAAGSLNIEALSVFSDRGRLSASGQVNLSAESPWQITFDITDVDASLADARLSGSIDARGTSNGRIIDGRPVAAVVVDDLAGNLNGHSVDGSANLAYADDGLQVEDAIVQVGDNVARFSAGFGTALEIDALVEFEALAQLGLDLSGSLSGDIRAATDFKVLEVAGTLGGADLAWRDYSAERLDATFAIPRTGRGTASTRIAGARVGDTVIEDIDLSASGTALAHQLQANTVTQDTRVDATVDAGFADGTWSGSMSALSIVGDLLGEWSLQEPAKFAASAAGFTLNKTCLSSGTNNGFACVELESNEPGALSFDMAVDEIPLAALPVTWPEGSVISGFVEGGANGQLANGRMTADARLQLLDLSLRTEFESDEVAVDFEAASATAAIEDNRLDGQFELRLQDSKDKLSGELVVVDIFDRESSINGTASIELNELAAISFFVPSVTDPTGRIAGTVEIAGSLAAPDIVGEIGLSDGSFGLANAGITVTDVAVTMRQSAVGRLSVEGRANSGDGNLAITGETFLSPDSGIRVELSLNGENFALVKLPDWQVTASPDITVSIDENEARVRGELGIPATDVTFRELPEGVQKPSPDVTIHRGETAAAPQRFIVDLDVRTSLGDSVNLSGFGLTTGLEGSVRIAGRSDTTYTSSGRLVLREGRYSAYGQELNIDSGELIFNGPLDNPTLNVRASRTASDGTVAGIHLTGTPKQPRSEVRIS
jgi:translocation and assembly module TamB